jgi:hypothetical protein
MQVNLMKTKNVLKIVFRYFDIFELKINHLIIISFSLKISNDQSLKFILNQKIKEKYDVIEIFSNLSHNRKITFKVFLKKFILKIDQKVSISIFSSNSVEFDLRTKTSFNQETGLNKP